MSNIVVKFQWNNELRRVTIENTQTFEQIGNLIKNLFKDAPASFSLKYRDEDGDVITLSSDIELKEAFKFSPVRFEIVDTTSKNKAETKKEEVVEDDEDDEQDLPFNFLFKFLSALPSERRAAVPNPVPSVPRHSGLHRLFGIPLTQQQQQQQQSPQRIRCVRRTFTPDSPQTPTQATHGPFFKLRPQQPQKTETTEAQSPVLTHGPFFRLRPVQTQKTETTENKQAEQKQFWIPIRVASQSSTETALPLTKTQETPVEKTEETTTSTTENTTTENTSENVTTSIETPAVETVVNTPEEPIPEQPTEISEKLPETEVTETQETRKVHPFEVNLNQLESMGFADREENIRLLVTNSGDIVKTVADLLN